MRSFTAEIIQESIEKKHELENGEVKVDSEEKPEERSTINNQENTNKRELEIAEAVQAWRC